jgi:hypothetical protein
MATKIEGREGSAGADGIGSLPEKADSLLYPESIAVEGQIGPSGLSYRSRPDPIVAIEDW